MGRNVVSPGAGRPRPRLAAVLCFGRPRPVRSGKPPGAAAQEAPGAAGEKAAAAGESRGGENRRTLAGAQPRVKGKKGKLLSFHGP